ncbi:pog element with krab domain [Plakobranchus ocellatus]|uniref:Pog element with krab domain n=1 Tax=Plakobranchus ocellatus TaxID=259542 RepID=A0AAV4DY02_9GAST|nr:pog element with krab domain [Plakobranchus ocellatus]
MCHKIRRAVAGANPEEVKKYFENLFLWGCVPRGNILNYDEIETILTDDPGMKKCIYIQEGCEVSREDDKLFKLNISEIFAGRAKGEMLPQYVVYKATNL